MAVHLPHYKSHETRNDDLGIILLVGGIVIFGVAVGLLLAL